MSAFSDLVPNTGSQTSSGAFSDLVPGGNSGFSAPTPHIGALQQAQPGAFSSLSDKLWSDLGSSVGGAFKSGVDQFKSGYQAAGQAKNPLSMTEAGLQEGAGIVNAAASPLAPIFSPIGKGTGAVSNAISDIPAVQKFAESGAGQATSRIAQDVSNTATLLPVVAGATGSIPEAVNNVRDTVNTVKGGVAINDALTPPEPSPEAAGSFARENITGANPALPKPLARSVEDTMPLQSKDVRIDELRNTLPTSGTGTGGVARKGIFGKSTPQPTEEDIQRGTLAHQYIGGVKDPIEKIANINQGIIDTSKKVDSFLDERSAPANFADMRNYMETNKPSVALQKDPGASETYQRATEGALNTLYNTMKSSAKASGDFGANTSGKDIRAARIAIDQQITKELGENAFGTPQYRGIKAAEIDTRNLLNRMVEDMVRYPGQMEQLNKMNDFVSVSKARGIEVDMNNPEVRTTLERQFKLNPTGEADAQKIAQEHANMSHLYDARDNMIDRYQSSVGKNKIQEAISSNPVAKAAVGTVKKAIPFGIGTHL